MKNEYVYFFKHKNISPIKIGRTCGDSVISRFNQFKTYSPFGSEIVGFFKCDNSAIMERQLHIQFADKRLHGEWFDIAEDICISIVNKYDKTIESCKKRLIEFISANPDSLDLLNDLLKKSLETSSVESENFNNKLLEYLIPSNKFTPTRDIINHLKSKGILSDGGNIGPSLSKLGFTSKQKRIGDKVHRGYLLELKL